MTTLKLVCLFKIGIHNYTYCVTNDNGQSIKQLSVTSSKLLLLVVF